MRRGVGPARRKPAGEERKHRPGKARAFRNGRGSERRRLALALILACLAALLPARAGAAPARLTVMVYLTGSTLESQAGAATEDLLEMAEALPEDGSMNILALAGGCAAWRSDIPADAVSLYRVTRQGLESVEVSPAQSMGSPETLLRLLEAAPRVCPAEEYALILWDHGAGPMMGVCFDERFRQDGDMDALSLAELDDALSRSPFVRRPLSWIGFDACLMASLETALTVAPYARYMIASQEPEPTEGWRYAFLSDAARDPDGAETGRRAAEAYAEACAGSLADVTLSCVDLGKLEVAAGSMSELFGALEVTPEAYAALASARAEARVIGCGTPFDYDLVDLIDLLQLYDESGVADCDALIALIEEAVVVNRSSGPFRNGLSVYYPFYNKTRYASPWASVSQGLRLPEGYRDFVDRISAVWLGEALADWNSPHPVEAEDERGERLLLRLSEEQAAQLSGARLVVVSEAAPGEYAFVYASDEVGVADGGLLRTEYGGEALYFVGRDGAPRTGAIDYRPLADGIAVPAMLFKRRWRDGAEKFQSTVRAVYIVYRRNARGQWRLSDVMGQGEAALGKSTLRLEDWDVIQFSSRARTLAVGEDGQSLPFEAWPYGRKSSGDELPVSELGVPAFLRLQDDEARYALFEMTDLQNNTVASELFPLPNPNRQRVWASRIALLDSEACEVVLETAETVTGAAPSLQLTYTAVNRTDGTLTVRLSDLCFNRTAAASDAFGGVCPLRPGEARTGRLVIAADALKTARVAMLDALSLTVECRDASGRTLAAGDATVPLSLSMAGFYRLESPQAPLDEADWAGVSVALIRLEGSGKGLLYLRNESGEARRISWHSFALDGVPCDALLSNRSELRLPDGCDAYLPLTLYPRGTADEGSAPGLSFSLYAFEDDLYDPDQWTLETRIRLLPAKIDG